MPLYPPPEQNPACQCIGNPFRAFLCPQGHMMECHAGYNCSEAGCSHLGRYDLDPNEVDALEAAAIARLKAGHMAPYAIDAEGNVIVQAGEGGAKPA